MNEVSHSWHRKCSPSIKKQLAKLNIHCEEDFFRYLPTDWQDWRTFTKISDAPLGIPCVFRGHIASLQTVFLKKRKFIKVIISQDTTHATAYWFNCLWIKKLLKIGNEYVWRGVFSKKKEKRILIHPSFEPVDKSSRAGRIVPVYPRIRGWSRETWNEVWNDISKKYSTPIPLSTKMKEVLEEYDFPFFDSEVSWRRVFHFPTDDKSVHYAMQWHTLIELLQRSLTAQHKEKGVKIDNAILYKNSFISLLPFSLTTSQKEVLEEIAKDLASGNAMRRLLYGDVGSGKTVLAALTAAICAADGYDSILVTPTQILAEQHTRTITKLWGEHNPYYVACETAHSSQQTSREKPTLWIGTTALLHRLHKLDNAVLVIFDEQHRFGVSQRATLEKGPLGIRHFLSLTATPIPRTLALAISGVLSISRLTEKPGERKKIITRCARSEEGRIMTWKYLEQLVKKGGSAYVICPRIEIGEEYDSESWDPLSVISTTQYILKQFPNISVGTVHGEMKKDEQEKIMQNFASGKIKILVATTVVEVGIDVPQAIYMIITGAERFGLATLHQLRGRVGRSDAQSYCVLYPANPKADLERLDAVVNTNDGFVLAEMDLQLRGAGHIFGTAQSGVHQEFSFPLCANEYTIQVAEKLTQIISKESPTILDWWKKALITPHHHLE